MHQFLLGGGGTNLQVQEPTPLVYKTDQWKAKLLSHTYPDQTHVMLMVIENKMVLCILINLNLHEIGLL